MNSSRQYFRNPIGILVLFAVFFFVWGPTLQAKPCVDTLPDPFFADNTRATLRSGGGYSPCYPRYIALDAARSRLYWYDEGANVIMRSSTDGSDLQNIASSFRLQSMAIDVFNQKLYWIERDEEGVVPVTRFLRANLDGSGQEQLFVEANRSYKDLSIDGQAGKMYWYGASPNNNYLIHSANLDGSDSQIFHTVDITYRSFDVDLDTGRAYWVAGRRLLRENNAATELVLLLDDPFTSFITMQVAGDYLYGLIYDERTQQENLYRMRRNGTELEIGTSLRSFADIAIDATTGTVYWAHVGGHQVFSSDFFGNNKNVLFDGLLAIPDPEPCIDGYSNRYECMAIDMSGYLPTWALGIQRGSVLNDLWGWTDPLTDREYALVGHLEGTSFVDVTNPDSPEYLGWLPRTAGTEPSNFRDIKVFDSHAYIVSEALGSGLQIFDLAQLRTVGAGSPKTFSESGHHSGFLTAHNIAINEDSATLYVMGARGEDPANSGCQNGGFHMMDLSNPGDPRFAGCFVDRRTGVFSNGYTHDAHCVTYRGPDAAFRGRDVCFGANETHLSIADVTNRGDGIAIGLGTYAATGYAHQGWLTEDHRYFLMNDEKDEARGLVSGTRTIIWDVSNLAEPHVAAEYFGDKLHSDHNLYVVGNHVYQSNYEGGLRVLDITDILAPKEVAWFDTFPCFDQTGFYGSWSNYPFFKSGNVIVADQDQGLFILKPWFNADKSGEEVPRLFWLESNYPNPFNSETTITYRMYEKGPVRLTIYDTLGRELQTLVDLSERTSGVYRVQFDASRLPSGVYFYTLESGGVSQTRSMALVR